METPSSTLFVAELPFDAQETDLITTFSAYEGYVSARIRKDKNNNTVGFVEFTDPNYALRAKDHTHGLKFGLADKGLTVQFAYKQPHPSSSRATNAGGVSLGGGGGGSSTTHSHLPRKQSDRGVSPNNNNNNSPLSTLSGSPSSGSNSTGSPSTGAATVQSPGGGVTSSSSSNHHHSHHHSHHHPHSTPSSSMMGINGHPHAVYGNHHGVKPPGNLSSSSIPNNNNGNQRNNNQKNHNHNNNIMTMNGGGGGIHHHHQQQQHHSSTAPSSSSSSSSTTTNAMNNTTGVNGIVPELPAFYSSPLPNNSLSYTYAASPNSMLPTHPHHHPHMIPALPIDASATLYVEGLPLDATEREVAHIFRQWPGYQSLRILQKEGKQYPSRTYNLCFVEFDNKYQATMSMHNIQGYRFDKNDTKGITITYAKTERKDKRKLSLASTNGGSGGNNNNNTNTTSNTNTAAATTPTSTAPITTSNTAAATTSSTTTPSPNNNTSSSPNNNSNSNNNATGVTTTTPVSKE